MWSIILYPQLYCCRSPKHLRSTLDPAFDILLNPAPSAAVLSGHQNPIHCASTILRGEGLRGMWSGAKLQPSTHSLC
jgi:hypothetical protein